MVDGRRSHGALAVFGMLLFLIGCGAPETVPPPTPDPPPLPAPPLEDEAGFIELEPITYSFGGEPLTTDLVQRIFYVFQAADEHPSHKPLVVFFNGGPGVATELLLGFNTAKRTVDQARTNGAAIADNPASWSRFANLLYLDPPNTGFSYAIPENPKKPFEPILELPSAEYNYDLDAAQCSRVVLRFLEEHPRLTNAPVILAGESYGGIRVSLMLDQLFHLEDVAVKDGVYRDDAFREEAKRHFHSILPDASKITPAVVSRQFGAQILIEPYLAGGWLEREAAHLLNQPDSPLFDVAKETGVPFVACQSPCSINEATTAVNAYVLQTQRDLHDISVTRTKAAERFYGSLAAFATMSSLAAAIGVDPKTITGLGADDRKGAVRVPARWEDREAFMPTSNQKSLIDELGALDPLDRYFIVTNDAVGRAFHGTGDLKDPRFTRAFLSNTRYVRTFITQARNDLVVYSPALPASLTKFNAIDHVEVGSGAKGSPRPETMTLHFKPNAFPSPASPQEIRFPMYSKSGHTVSMNEPLELSEDVEAWLAEAK